MLGDWCPGPELLGPNRRCPDFDLERQGGDLGLLAQIAALHFRRALKAHLKRYADKKNVTNVNMHQFKKAI